MLTARTFLTSKKGEELDDCQDSIHPFPIPDQDTDYHIFAVSDGTTTSFFSGAWSATLTHHFGENPDQAFSDWDTWLRGAQSKWEAKVGERARANDASFFTRNGFHARKPAAATLAALALGDASENGRSWRALVLGDSCIFFLHANGQPRVLNLQSAAEFSSVVKTVESWPKDDPHLPITHESSLAGSEPPIREHDTVLLASDALSKWMLLRHERGRPVWGSVIGLNNDAEFVELVKNARAEAEDPLENDDVALVVLKFGEVHPVYREQQFKPNPAPQSAPPVSLPPLVDSGASQAEHEPRRLVPPKPRRLSRHVAVLVASTTLFLAGVLWLRVTRDRAIATFQTKEDEIRRLSAELKSAANEKAELTAQANRYNTDLQAALRVRDAADNRRKSLVEQQKKDLQTIAELKQQVATLEHQIDAYKEEQVLKPVQPPDRGDTPSPTRK